MAVNPHKVVPHLTWQNMQHSPNYLLPHLLFSNQSQLLFFFSDSAPNNVIASCCEYNWVIYSLQHSWKCSRKNKKTKTTIVLWINPWSHIVVSGSDRMWCSSGISLKCKRVAVTDWLYVTVLPPPCLHVNIMSWLEATSHKQPVVARLCSHICTLSL